MFTTTNSKGVKILFALALMSTVLLMGASSAFAQLPTDVTMGVASASTAPTPGVSEQTLASLWLIYTGSGDVEVDEIPLTASATGGASLSHLSACGLYDEDGDLVTSNTLGSLSSTNMINVEGVSLESGVFTELRLRCDVDDDMPSGGDFVFGSGMVIPTPTTPPTVPGIPNTGTGGDMLVNAMVLVASGALAAFGLGYVLRKRT